MDGHFGTLDASICNITKAHVLKDVGPLTERALTSRVRNKMKAMKDDVHRLPRSIHDIDAR